MGAMKALSLWQPYASLIQVGAKTCETRSWPAPSALCGSDIAIHAAKKWDKELHDLSMEYPFHDLLPVSDPDELPRGSIVAVATLTKCVRFEKWHEIPLIKQAGDWDQNHDQGRPEFYFGDFTAGRWGWVLANVRPLNPAVPCRGAQGLFDVPDEALAQVQEQLGQAV